MLVDSGAIANIDDKTLALLLEREESILGNILEECGHLVRLADEQAMEVADMLDQVD